MEHEHDEKQTITVPVRIPRALVRQVDAEAAADDRSRSYIIRKKLSESLNRSEQEGQTCK